MTGEEATIAVVDALEASSIRYMLVGSLSTNAYGIARSTRDADFVVELGNASLAELVGGIDPCFRLDQQATFETITMTTRRVLRIAESPFTIEFFHLSDDPHDQERFRRRHRRNLLGREVQLPTAEDVVITKLRWAAQGRRSKDRDDARDVIAVQGDRLDWNYIDMWCAQHGTSALLDEIRRSIPPV